MWLIKVFGAICLTAFCAAQDAQYEAILSVTPNWLEVFPNEKVQLTCSLNDSYSWTIAWYRDDEQIPETNVAAADTPELTLTAEKQHAGKYSCQGFDKTENVSTARSSQYELKVYDRPTPTVRSSNMNDSMFLGESVTFTCTVAVSSGWEYVWYHNKEERQASSSNTYTIGSVQLSDRGAYTCKARRGKDPIFYTNEAVTSLQVSELPTPTLKRLSPWSDVFESEKVEFSCNLNSSDWTFAWYRNDGKGQQGIVNDGSTYTIKSVMQTHEGSYTCKAQHKTRSVSTGMSNKAEVRVFKNRPTPTLTKTYGFDLMYVGEMVNFTCAVNVASDWNYNWFRNKNKLQVTGTTISIKLGPSDGGNYSCSAFRGETTITDSSKEIPQNVVEIPVPSLKESSHWLDVFPTESVKVTCGMEMGSGWTYTWHKDGQKVEADDALSFESNGATLLISSASAKHEGRYRCKGHIHGRSVSSPLSSRLTITVYGEKPSVKLTQDPEYKTMYLEESVTFRCHINVSSGWEYLWYMGDVPLNVTVNMYERHPVQISDQGSYKCRAKRGSDQPFYTNYSQIIDLGVEDEKPKPSVTRTPDTDKLYTGESVSFECNVDNPSEWDYTWYKDDIIHGRRSHLDIHNATATTAGTYKCAAMRQKTKYNTTFSDNQTLYISEIPVPILKKSSQWLDVFPTETVKLKCGMSSQRTDWTYTWYRNGKEVQGDKAVSFDSDKSTLSINSASASHRGNYSCTGKFKSRPVLSSFSPKVQLHVYDTKPDVRLTHSPDHRLLHTGDSISFTCHSFNSSGWEYVWYKDHTPLSESGNIYNISSVVTTSAGSYNCQVKRGKNTVFHSDLSVALKLNVEERPQAAITLLTGWSKVFATDTLLLTCEVENSQDVWNYTWFKEGHRIDLLHSETHSVTPQNDPEQSLYSCQGVRTGRPSYSKLSKSFKTKNLLLKRRVLLSISGCIFFGIIAVFLGCIVLRVMRKPDDNEDKLEEANLFLTMAQLKDRSDAPCPLVDYITEEALNAPPKEGDENDTTCSETTPLPIFTQEDQAVATENRDKEETNGGLVSFKQ